MRPAAAVTRTDDRFDMPVSYRRIIAVILCCAAPGIRMNHPYLSERIARHIPGHALQREFYTDPRIFDADMERMLLRHWFCVAHMSDLPHAGDFLLADLGAESVIIVRNRND